MAVEIDDDQDFRLELTRLSQSFGIGVIQLNIDVPDDSSVLLPAGKKAEIDWNTVTRIAAMNPDFRGFINSAAKSIQINHPTVDDFDEVLTDAELETYLQKLRTR